MDENIISCSPEKLGITSASIIDLIDLAKERDIRMHSLVVMRHGRIAAELYWSPYCAEEPHHLYSFSKSITSAAVGIAVDEGLLSLDDRIVSFFPRKVHDGCDDRIYSVTVEHLLTMTAGISIANEITMMNHIDWTKWFLNSQFEFFPGEKFIYNSLDTYMLSAILRKVTGMGLVDYLMPRLFEPLGIERPQWVTCPLGIECGGWGLHLTSRDMAKFTQMYLGGGVYEGKRILSEAWVRNSLSVHTDNSVDTKFLDHPDTKAGYGFCFWHGRDDSWRADGMLGQYGIMLPEKDTIIVTTCASPNQMLVLDLLWDTVVPAIDSIPEGSEPDERYAFLCDAAKTLSVDYAQSTEPQEGLAERISGHVFTFTENNQSMVPFLVKNLYKVPSLGIETVQFNFDGDMLTFSWCESFCDNRIELPLTGETVMTEIQFDNIALRCVCRAVWTDASVLQIDVRPINTPHDARVSFRFDGNRVIYTYDEDPPFTSSIRMLLDMSYFIRPYSGSLSKFAGGLIPSVTGQCDDLTPVKTAEKAAETDENDNAEAGGGGEQ